MYAPSSDWQTSNTILSLLPEQQRRRICESAPVQQLPRGFVLLEANTPIDDVYFIEHGVASLAVPLAEGMAIEASSVGKEGMIGLPLFLNTGLSPFRAVQDIPGQARRLSKDVFLAELDRGVHLRMMLSRYTAATWMAAGQRAACNIRHTFEQRLITWLLTTDEQVGYEPFRVTHQTIAGILGVRRATVSTVAGTLQEAGFIAYRRGRIAVVNRIALEGFACECYGKISKLKSAAYAA
jgi:CRP-like cAMP-binding protein